MKLASSILLLFVCLFSSCKKSENNKATIKNNEIAFADGLEIYKYQDFTVMKITKPWPEATKTFTYVCANSKEHIPDSLAQYTFIQTPVQNLVVTSTTHISSIVTLNEHNRLIGFPHLEFISSPVVRTMIQEKKIQELSDQESLNFEKTVDLHPKLIVGLSMDSETSKFNQFEKAGIPVLYNADWVEKNPLGKAEWIKFFGVLFDKQEEANTFFQKIVSEYQHVKSLVASVDKKPTVLSGSIFQDVWYAPQGESWMATFIKDAQGNYLWKDSKGTGSLSLSLEAVLEKGISAEIWIGPGQFTSYQEMEAANKHYSQFKAFQNQKIYSYSLKKGATGGVVFYEDAPNRPDLVLKDLIHLLHPHILPNYQPTFILPIN
ncbi:MAG TPA: ABC transporter substrate-binding protein [Flavobacterium sp.]|nr:ABC transporter substrate-binding protein [Flavobacterium sp.]